MPLPQNFLDAVPDLQAAAAASGSDYKAIVYIYLHGGNDAHNTVIPSGAGYAQYAADRSVLAISQASLTPLSGRDYALHPEMTGMTQLFNDGRAAAVLNVGTLVQPVTRAQWLANSGVFPKALFSHIDQERQWQHCRPDLGESATGWIGRMMDLVDPAFNGASPLDGQVTIAGINTAMLAHEQAVYAIGPLGAAAVQRAHDTNGQNGWSEAMRAAYYAVTAGAQTHLLKDAIATVAARSMANYSGVSGALGSLTPSATDFSISALASQLGMVSRLIRLREHAAVSHRRQVFFVTIGGFDTHANSLTDHGNLIGTVSAAVKLFYDELVTYGLQNNVLITTASDFGRAKIANGSGTDHGWGGHHFVVGGAVQGGRFYTKATPGSAVSDAYIDDSLGGPNDAGQGRLIPTIAVDEVVSTIARWFGVPAQHVPLVVPNIVNFSTPDLGFMTA